VNGLPGAGPPSVEAVEAVGASTPPALRNLRITQTYHELSAAVASLTGPGANWCTFATWASRQAGRTIRAEDLGRKIEEVFAGSDAVARAVISLRGLRRQLGRGVGRQALIAAIREACLPLLTVGHVADAVARGNKKVFDEIGLEFARFVAAAAEEDDAAVSRVCDALRPGEPPEGQRLLAAAFRDYQAARVLADPKARAERLLLANLRIGLHEQTRLQPEIAEALNAPVLDPAELRRRLLIALVGSERLAAASAGRTRAWGGLDAVCADLIERLRAVVREVITEELMTIALPLGARRLGRDLAGAFPPELAALENPELRALLAAVDPTADSTAASGARDWASLPERMHTIADLFRLEHADPSLLEPPFTQAQQGAIAAGSIPDGDL
jgi:hypothetical protein